MAYGTVLKEQREVLHGQTAQAIERLYKDNLDEHYDELAYHYQCGGSVEKAIEYLQKAGQQAARRSANAEVIDHLTAALDLLLKRPETLDRATQELQLRLILGPALLAAQGWAVPAVEQNYTRARMLSVQLGDARARFQVLWGLRTFYMGRGDMRTAQAMAEECLQVAEQVNQTEMLLQAHYALGVIYQWRGELVRGREALGRSLALCRRQLQAQTPFYGGQNPKVSILRRMALVLWYLGYPEQTLKWKQEALQLAREIGQPYDLMFASYYTIMMHLERGDGRVAQEYADGLVALASEHGFVHFLPVGALYRGAALIVQGQWEEGIAQVQQGLDASVGEGLKTEHLTWLARGYKGVGRVKEGLAAVAEALRLVEKNDERYYAAEVWRMKGELLLAQASKLGD